ncbi:hypothetical protein [Desulfobacula sp.]
MPITKEINSSIKGSSSNTGRYRAGICGSSLVEKMAIVRKIKIKNRPTDILFITDKISKANLEKKMYYQSPSLLGHLSNPTFIYAINNPDIING